MQNLIDYIIDNGFEVLEKDGYYILVSDGLEVVKADTVNELAQLVHAYAA